MAGKPFLNNPHQEALKSMEEKKLFIKEVMPGIFLMDEAHEATGYLVVGNEMACVIDTMNGYNDLYQAVRKLTDKPLTVVNTHGHPDQYYPAWACSRYR